MKDIEKNFVQLLGLVIEGRSIDIRLFAKRELYNISRRRPDLAELARSLLVRLETHDSFIREANSTPLPFDADSRLELIKREPIPEIAIEPTWTKNVESELKNIIEERLRADELNDVGLKPTKTVLFIGPPGTGKTLAARWLARQLDKPLLTLELSSVMSSLLGRTGNNIRVVLDFAKQIPSILFLDEFDAIAKRRDDITEVGELKRLVNVLLQAVDDWSSDGLLLAATNHSELLDHAVWRRFDRIISFPLPNEEDIKSCITKLISNFGELREIDLDILSNIFKGKSFADITREIETIKKYSILNAEFFYDTVLRFSKELVDGSSFETKIQLAKALNKKKLPQRKIALLTGLSRVTVRKYLGTARKELTKQEALTDA